MLQVTPTLNFHGQCEEAIKVYEQAFGATVQSLLRYADADPRDWDTPLTDEQQRLVYHAEIYIGHQRVMCSDILESDIAQGTALFLTVTFDTADQVKRAYDVLREGSRLIYPMVSTTYSSCLVSFVDRYGFRWVLMTEQTEE